MAQEMLAVYVHSIDPHAVHLWGPVSIRWYGLSYLVGFFLAFFLIRRVTRVGVSTLQPSRVADLVVYVAIGVLLGGRLGYVLFYKPSLLITTSSSFPYWDLLAINQGGMASHGGILGAIIACFYFARHHGHRPGHILDLVAFPTALGLCIGRVANFINGELYGRPCREGLPWAVKFPQEIHTWTNLDAKRDLALRQAIDVIAPDSPFQQDPLTRWGPRIVEAMQSGEGVIRQTLSDILTPHLMARHPSQLYQAILEGGLVFLMLVILWVRPRKPCVIGGAFLVGYGLMRVVGEIFRMPDEHIRELEASMLHLTRGQLLSIPLVVIGVWMIWHFSKAAVDPMGGWMRWSEQAASQTGAAKSMRGSSQA